MRTVLRFILAGAVLTLLALLGWESLYYGPYEHKDLRYQCWKLGFYPLKIDGALETMVVDPRHDSLVLGKTEEQLVRKFGYVLPITQAPQYDQLCNETSPYRGQSVLILRRSNWMVLMENGRGKDLILLKGC